jgi:hypothetical protein
VRTVADREPGAGAEQTQAPDRAPAQAENGDQAPVSPSTSDIGVSGDKRGSHPAPQAPEARSGDDQPLLDAQLSTDFQLRWEEVQTRFVDEPRGAVEDADSLVANVMQQLAEGFAQERERLEAQWGRGENISTEDLRVALQRYRSFFRRLLST